MDIRKVIRWVVNIGSLVVGVLALPEFGAVVPEAWLPGIGSAVAVVNVVLSWIRSVGAGEPILKSF
jgi:hypothetical protein